MKTLRFLFEVFLAIILFPVIVIVEVVAFIWCIRAAHSLDKTTMYGVKLWFAYLKQGLMMNKDFVENGL